VRVIPFEKVLILTSLISVPQIIYYWERKIEIAVNTLDKITGK
jgi:hypothetical protein